jgi:allantoin racemase
MRIWHQGLIPRTPTSAAYFEARERRVTELCSVGTSVVFHGLNEACFPEPLTPAIAARFELGEALMALEVAAQVRAANEDDYDAVIVGILQDTGLSIARTVTDLPVVGYGQATALLGRCLGRRLGVLAFNPALFELFEERINSYAPGFVHAFQETRLEYVDVLASFSEESAAAKTRDALYAAAEALVRRGCDVLVAGQMLLAEAAWKLDIATVDGVPVLDGLGAAVGLAEALVRLRRVHGTGPARQGIHGATPVPELLALLASRTNDQGTP